MDMTTLPLEIIEQVLTDDVLCIVDVVNFSKTCSYFYELVRNCNAIWKVIHAGRTPKCMPEFDEKAVSSWYSEVKYLCDLITRMYVVLDDMPARFYKRYELSDSDLEQWRDMMDERPVSYHYLIAELMEVALSRRRLTGLDCVPLKTCGNLTYRYYGTKAVRFLRQRYLAKEWAAYMALEAEQQVLERGAVMIAQWCQPATEVTLADIGRQLDGIVDRVRGVLREKQPQHPLFSESDALMSTWVTRNLTANHWTVNECRQIIDAMVIVFYDHMGFAPYKETYFLAECSYINEVFSSRRGQPVMMAIIFEGVARRLGIHCEPIALPSHFLLRWTYGPGADDALYIDALNYGHMTPKGSCTYSSSDSSPKRGVTYTPSTAKQVVARIANNLESVGRQHIDPNGRITRLRSVLELLRLINSNDLSCLLSLAKLYMLYNMDCTELMEYLMNQQEDIVLQAQAHQIMQMLQDHEAHHKDDRSPVYPQVEVAPRTPELRYAVGMVMRHLRLSYVCVIYDWDPVCLASLDWQEQMNVHDLNKKSQQPFYNVLVDDGSHRYVAQENLFPIKEPLAMIVNEDLGSHFSHYCETHFVPNLEKEKEYPEDGNIRRIYHWKLMNGYYCQ